VTYDPKTIDKHHLDMSRDDGMDEHGIDWVCGCHLVRFWLESWSTREADSCHTLTTNQTQHHSHAGPDDHPKTIDSHHLDISRDDGMDEHGIDWVCRCHLVRFWFESWATCAADSCHTLTTNQTQHHSHGPDDHPKTID
jgi:hypothetical protein